MIAKTGTHAHNLVHHSWSRYPQAGDQVEMVSRLMDESYKVVDGFLRKISERSRSLRIEIPEAGYPRAAAIANNDEAPFMQVSTLMPLSLH